MLIFHQIGAVVRKNLTVMIRDRPRLFWELLACLAGLLCVYLVQSILIYALIIITIISINEFFIRVMVIEMVEDKMERFKETFRVMNLKLVSYISGWLLTAYIKGIIVCGIMSIGILTQTEANLTGGDVIEVLVHYLLFMLGSTHFSIALNTLFSQPKLAGEISGIIFGLSSVLFLVLPNTTKEPWVLYVTCLLPHTAFGYYLTIKLFTIVGISTILKIRIEAPKLLYVQIFNIFFYLILFFYLDQVLPVEFGVRRSPVFCLEWIWKRRRSNNRISGSPSEENQPTIQLPAIQGNVVSPRPEDQSTGQKVSVDVQKLNKSFGKFHAVKNLNFQLYEGEIFCLLGDSGAGKTTTISLLTGMLSFDDGEITVYNRSLRDEPESVRSFYGLCPERDIIYPFMTVEDHLRYIAAIKGIPSDERAAEIQKTMKETNLWELRQKEAVSMSMGDKRKLCLAMAVIGGSKILFVDEPTSGLDPVSREMVWEVLVALRSSNRTIVLTTHHLDEAEILGDRVGIMRKGELIALGTADQIKTQYGHDYHLVITSKDQHDEVLRSNTQLQNQILHTAISFIPEAKLSHVGVKGPIQIDLPYGSHKAFSNLAKELEKINGITLHLDMNTLEDAFMSIGQNKDQAQGSPNNRVGNYQSVPSGDLFKDRGIEIPPSLASKSSVTLWTQIHALLWRKTLVTFLNWHNWLKILLPFIFIVILDLGLQNLLNSSSANYNEILAAFISSGFISLAYAINSTFYCAVPVFEREKDLTHMLYSMGCSKFAYWLTTLLFDLVIFTFMGCVTIFFFYLVDLQVFVLQWDNYILTIFTFGLSLLNFLYVIGFAFKTSSYVYKFVWFILYLGSLVLPVLINTEVFDPESGFYKFLDYFLGLLFPCSQLNMTLNLYADNPLDSVHYLFTEIRQSCGIMTATGVGYFCALMLIEYWSNIITFIKRRWFPNTVSTAQFSNLPDDIENSVNRGHQSSANSALSVNSLTKVWGPNSKGLDAVSFRVAPGEIFGLVGPVSSSKSTILDIITRKIVPTSGTITIDGDDVVTGFSSKYGEVGYCPQTNPLWDDLTVRQHLGVFGRLKGLKGTDLDQQIEFFLNAAMLSDFENNKANEISGGTKRKLIVSDSLIGGGVLSLLDNPTTGMDPISKRSVWKMISTCIALRKSGCVYSTRSLVEAQHLCSSIGILDNGKIAVNGSVEDLKKQYDNHFTITLKKASKSSENDGQIQMTLEKTINGVQSVKHTVPTPLLTYHVPKSSGHTFSQLYDVLDLQLKDRALIADFSITQHPLEDSFLTRIPK